jgi:hypothetical protein
MVDQPKFNKDYDILYIGASLQLAKLIIFIFIKSRLDSTLNRIPTCPN